MVDLREILIGVIFTAIAVVVALAIYPSVHNAVFTMTGNTTPMSAVETAMLNLIVLIFPAAIALTPVALLYKMSQTS
jgi:hypothetical protein